VRLANPEAARLLDLCTQRTFPATTQGVHSRPGVDLELDLEVQLHPALIAESEQEQEICFEVAGGPLWVAVRRVCLPSEGANLVGRDESVLTLRDVSARKRMEQEREAARDSVALAQVSAILAHEIRNPLASLELFAGLVSEDPGRRDEWISHLRAGIRALSGTVNNVLTLQGNTPLLMETVDVVTEASLAVEFLQPLAQQAEVSLCFRATQNGSAGLVSRIHGNRSAFHQILINLCANALRHTPRGGSVEVTCQLPVVGEAAPLRVAVIDSGCGIPAEHMPHLFEIGFSGSGATSGLGLAVCDRLVRQIGGALSVESCVGLGSTFTLEFPRA
jgi:signal transduction histidine kinase